MSSFTLGYKLLYHSMLIKLNTVAKTYSCNGFLLVNKTIEPTAGLKPRSSKIPG